MTHAEMLLRLREDLAAASEPECDCFPPPCNHDKARARLAALPGPELAQVVATIDALTEREDIPDGEIIACIQGNTEAVLDRCATALEVKE